MPRKLDSYATLLRIRRRQEDIKAQALAAARRALLEMQAQRDQIAAEQRRMLESARDNALRRFDAEDVRRYYQYERHLARLCTDKDADLHRLRREVSSCRAELSVSRTSRRKAEKLDEWEREEYREAVRQDELKTMDESAMVRFSYARRGSSSVGGKVGEIKK